MWCIWQPPQLGLCLRRRRSRFLPATMVRATSASRFLETTSSENYLNFASYIGVTSTPVDRDRRATVAARCMWSTRSGQSRTARDNLPIICERSTSQPGHDRAGANNPSVIAATAARSQTARRSFSTPSGTSIAQGSCSPNGVIYMAFGSHGDVGDFYGWIMAYDSKSLKQLASYNTAPDWGQGGVWQSGTGLAADDEVYLRCRRQRRAAEHQREERTRRSCTTEKHPQARLWQQHLEDGADPERRQGEPGRRRLVHGVRHDEPE